MSTPFDFANFGNMFGGMQGGTPTGLDALLSEDQRKLMGRNATLAAAAALLQASGRSTTPINLGQALGSALQAGQQGYQQARAGSVQDLLVGEKLKEAQDERQRNVDYFEMLRRAGQPAPVMQQAPLTGVAVPPVERFVSETAPTARPAATGPFANLTPQQLALMQGLPRKEGLQFALDATKPEASPEAIRTLNALGLAPTLANLRLLDKPEASPSELRILEATGTPPTLENIMKLRRSGAASQTVDIKMPGNQQFLAGVGTDISKTLSDLTAGATAANQTLANVDRILPALDKAVLGPGADYRTTLLRVGQQLGIAGANANEVLSKTATVVQGLAQAELDAAAQTKGQGSLTGPEREMLRRAAAGDQTLTSIEIQTALNAAQKSANYRIKLQQDYVKRASKLPGFEQFAPMYEVTPYTSGSNPLLNLIDQTLQQRQGGTR
jgi:hypothetical protein